MNLLINMVCHLYSLVVLGNGIDRILNGYVIDFIKIKSIDFPVFNIADIVINIGVLILMTSYFRYKNKFDE